MSAKTILNACPRTILLLAVLALFSLVVSTGQEAGSRTASRDSMEAHFSAARKAQQTQNYAEAEKEYQAVLALQPRFAEVHMNLGLIYQLQNRDADAMAEFKRALDTRPRLAGANFFLGVDYCKMGKGGKAIPYLQTAADQEPGKPEIQIWLATAFEMTGQIQAEVDTLRRALKLEPENVDLLYLLGNSYERLGQSEVAALQKRAPGSGRAEHLLAESYAMSSEWPTAVIHFQNALAAAPKLLGLHVELGEVLLHAGKVPRALREFDDELELNAHSVRALVRRGEAELIEGGVDRLLADWSQAISIDEPQAERVLGIGQTAFGEAASESLDGESREKIARFVPALQAQDTQAAHLALAFIAAQGGTVPHGPGTLPSAALVNHQAPAPIACGQTDVSKTLEEGHLSSATPCLLRILPERLSPQFRAQVASALLEAAEYEAALQALAALSASELDSSEVSFWRARCYEKLAASAYVKLYQADRNSYRVHQLQGDLSAAKGDDVAAMAEYRAAIDLKPSLPNLHYSLGHLLWKNSKVPQARVELEAELALNPHHAGALNDLGQTYLLEQQSEKALSYLNRALSEGLENPEIHRDVGSAYLQLGNYQKAGAEFNKALAIDHDGSVHFKLANVYKAMGEKDKAAHEYALAGDLNRESHRKVEQQTERRIEIEK